MEALSRLRLSRRTIKCPSCKKALIFDGLDVEIKGGPDVFTVKHKVCSQEQPRPLHLCVHCGSQSSHSKKRLINTYCKCPNKDNETPPSNSTPDPPSINIL